MVILMLVLGLGVLTIGAELLVRGSSRLAMAMGISPVGGRTDRRGFWYECSRTGRQRSVRL
jgi:hypothetical protein